MQKRAADLTVQTALRHRKAQKAGRYQVLVHGVFASGVPLTIHHRGGASRDGDGLFWEILGAEGEIRVSGPSGHTQMVQLALKGARGEEKTFKPLELPVSYREGWPAGPNGNCATHRGFYGF